MDFKKITKNDLKGVGAGLVGLNIFLLVSFMLCFIPSKLTMQSILDVEFLKEHQNIFILIWVSVNIVFAVYATIFRLKLKDNKEE